MQTDTIPINDIKISPSRMRREMGNIDNLADSISRVGLIQPVVLDSENNLVAGERRLRAHQFLGLESIRYVRRENLAEDQRAELEFEENFQRKSMTWQEECLGMLTIYEKRKRAGRLQGFEENWTLVVAEMFGMAAGTVNYILAVAKRLRAEQSLDDDKRKYWKFSSANEAYRIGLLGEKIEEANRLLAEREKTKIVIARTQSKQTQDVAETARIVEVSASPDLLARERERYERNPHNTIPFEEYWANKQKITSDANNNAVYLSNQLFHLDCIPFMLENPGRFDHIITDIPYGIDMINLSSVKDISNMVDAHDVDENEDLITKFFPAAFTATREHSFVITFCDQSQWQHMHNHATSAGFRVQRWPYIWKKEGQSCKNEAASYNTTKDYEIIMICRKPSAVLATKATSSIIVGSNTEAIKLTGSPFAKPFEVTTFLADLVSIPGQSILEPFACRGSMVMALLNSKRSVVACEKDEAHYNALLTNMKTYFLNKNPNAVFK